MENIRKGKLNHQIAGRIIEEVSKVLDYDINIMDIKGEIIASTDKERLNTFHEGAFKIVNERLDQLIVNNDTPYEGCKNGINLRIHNGNTLIGVIGITGEIDEIIKYAKIIKKMTEIMVINLFQIYESTIYEQEKLFFFNSFLNGDGLNDKRETERKLVKYNLFPDKPMFVATIHPAKERFLINHRGIAFVNISNTTILICNAANASAYRDTVATCLQDTGFDQHLCAVGSLQTTFEKIHLSYVQSKRILLQKKHLRNGIFFYEDALKELLFDEIPSTLKEEYRAKIFNGISATDLDDVIDFIDIYCTLNGSITKIADQLYIHKNTVQYKINRMKQLTGKDLRVIDEMIELYMAAKI